MKENILEMLKEEDMDFYDKYLINLSEEELAQFLEENSDFLEE